MALQVGNWKPIYWNENKLNLCWCGACGVVVNALSCVVHKSTGGFLPYFLNTIRNVQKRKLSSLNFNPGCIKVVDTFRG
jgi:hypothetical protein